MIIFDKQTLLVHSNIEFCTEHFSKPTCQNTILHPLYTNNDGMGIVRKTSCKQVRFYIVFLVSAGFSHQRAKYSLFAYSIFAKAQLLEITGLFYLQTCHRLRFYRYFVSIFCWYFAGPGSETNCWSSHLFLHHYKWLVHGLDATDIRVKCKQVLGNHLYRRLGELQKTDGEAIHNETLLEHLEVQGKESFWRFVDILCKMKGKFREVGEELRAVSTDGL